MRFLKNLRFTAGEREMPSTNVSYVRILDSSLEIGTDVAPFPLRCLILQFPLSPPLPASPAQSQLLPLL